MASLHPTTPPEHEAPSTAPTGTVDIVWGAPSTEMLEAEARGEIILVEDLQRNNAPHGGSRRHGSNV